MAKLKLALWWSASCGGCDIAVLDTNEKILDVAALADIVLWPVALDFKYHHVRAMPDKSIDVCLFNGAVRNSEQEQMARLLRAKSRVMVAFGSCSCFGGIPGLANFTHREDIFQRAYLDAPSVNNEEKVLPQTSTKVQEGMLELPEFYDSVSTLAQVVDVEYFVPGCPPTVEQILKFVTILASGQLPPVGTVLASDKALCEECPRKKENKTISKIYRVWEIVPDPEKCLLEQGLICCGPATRGGCGYRCIRANMPCRGCFGPPPGVQDQGAKLVSAIASIYEAKDEAGVAKLLEELVDPAGTFYRFTLSTSMLKRGQLVRKE